VLTDVPLLWAPFLSRFLWSTNSRQLLALVALPNNSDLL